MPRKGDRKPEKRDKIFRVRFTKAETARLDADVESTGICKTELIRQRALGDKPSRANAAITVTKDCTSRILAALGQARSAVIRLEDSLRFEGVALPDEWRSASAEMHKAAILILSISPAPPASDDDDDHAELLL